LKVFVSCRSSLVEFLGSHVHIIISYVNSNTLTSLFTKIYIFLVSFIWLIAKISSSMLKRYRESGQPCLVPDFSRLALSFSPFNFMQAIGLLCVALIIFRYEPHNTDFFNTFNMKGCWILSKAFSTCSEVIIWFCSFISFFTIE